MGAVPTMREEEIEVLRRRLADAEDTLRAIRTGRVDAVVIDDAAGPHVSTLESADLPYRRFLEQMGEGALSLDASGAILYCNRFFSELVGRDNAQTLGVPFEAFVALSSVASFRAALASDELQHVGASLCLPDGSQVPVQLTFSPLGTGADKRVTLVVTDLSERERLREVSAAREAAEAASLAKDQFLAAVGHELRNPLQVMMGWAMYLLRQPEPQPPRIRKALETIFRNAELQRKLIEDLLDISRIVSGKLRLERTELDLGELARSAEASLALSAEAKNVRLDVHVDRPVRLVGDAQRLEQVLTNLLGNAIKFTPPGGHVRLSIEQHDGDVCVVVEDDGQGIDAALLPRVFELFRQGGEIRRRESGLGLGLSIAKRLVELHEGTIEAASEGVGRGATFTVLLPSTPSRASSVPPAGLVDVMLPLRGMRILVVDDEPDARELTARLLEDAGAEVVSVSDSAAALAHFESERFDLVISDLVMPGMDGLELANELRERHGKVCPLLAISGRSDDESRDRAERAGFSLRLIKPVDGATLCRVVSDLAGRGRRLDA